MRLLQKERVKAKVHETITTQKQQEKFKQAMGLSGDDDASTDWQWNDKKIVILVKFFSKIL